MKTYKRLALDTGIIVSFLLFTTAFLTGYNVQAFLFSSLMLTLMALEVFLGYKFTTKSKKNSKEVSYYDRRQKNHESIKDVHREDFEE